MAEAAEPLPEIEHEAFAAHFDRYAERRVVLLGEASRGTSEFYRARAAITRHLIARHGFTIVAVEADWPDGLLSRPMMQEARWIRMRAGRVHRAARCPERPERPEPTCVAPA